MKLWHKVFLCTLALTVLAVFVTSQFVIQLDFYSTVNGEVDRSVSEHAFFSAGISSRVAYRKASNGSALLGDAEVENILIQAATEQVNSDSGMAVYLDGKRFAAANMHVEPREGELLRSIRESPVMEEECRTVIRENEGAHYIVSFSYLPIEGVRFELYTLRDVSRIYQERDAQARYAQEILLVLSLMTALVQFLVIRRLLAPLGRVNRSIQEIAKGNYALRLKETGSWEFRELSQNINTMSASVEENVEQIQSLADGRKQFIDNLAHEMKTPLTSILGFADLLRIKRTVSDKQRRDFSGVIVEEAKRLQGLSGKLMELAVTNNTKPDYATLDVDSLFRDIYLAVTPLLLRRGVKLLCESSGQQLYADKELVKSLLYNLIDNAAKASKEGEEVLLSCAEGESTVILSVSDWGMGMDEKTVRRATEAFYMADKSRSRKNGGAGLGLALCVRIAEMHGARLQIKSKLGEGTTVFVAFPIGREAGEGGGCQ